MFDQILDTYRRAAESTLQFQQLMLRNWTTQQWPTMMGPMMPTNPGTAWLEQVHVLHRKWGETVTSMLTKHREALDVQYKAGIKTIEESFKVGEARDPEQFRRLAEELWKHSFEALRTVTEEQMREFQEAMQKWFELVSQGTKA